MGVPEITEDLLFENDFEITEDLLIENDLLLLLPIIGGALTPPNDLLLLLPIIGGTLVPPAPPVPPAL